MQCARLCRRHGWHVALGYVVGFLVLLVTLGWQSWSIVAIVLVIMLTAAAYMLLGFAVLALWVIAAVGGLAAAIVSHWPAAGRAVAVLAALVDGTADAVATDHAPHTQVDKEAEFGLAANGISGVETALGVLLAAEYLVAAAMAVPSRIGYRSSQVTGTFV